MPPRHKRHANLPPSHTYGSFAKTNNDLLSKPNGTLSSDSHALETDSGMSSEETDDSAHEKVTDVTSPADSAEPEVITKCLTQESQWSEVPCCSSVNYSFKADAAGSSLDRVDGVSVSKARDFIVIDLNPCEISTTRDILGSDDIRRPLASNLLRPDVSESVEHVGVVSVLACSPHAIECDRSCNVASSQTLVPVVNNEIVTRNSQKIVSLSLSILLAALLQAMRCFAEFLENFVVPQRQ